MYIVYMRIEELDNPMDEKVFASNTLNTMNAITFASWLPKKIVNWLIIHQIS